MAMQHNTLSLCVAAWADNAAVKTFYNFQNAVVIEDALLQQGMDDDGNREKDQALVDAPEQMVAYCETFQLDDKGNSVESRYLLGMGGRS